MKKVLYLSNIQVPYRVRFFNALAENCALTVLYESSHAPGREKTWAAGEKRTHPAVFLDKTGKLRLFRELASGYDAVIIGCYNRPVQMAAMLFLKLIGKPYILNLDGEPFLWDRGLRGRIKKRALSGAAMYLTAGERTARQIAPLARGRPVIPYRFSSLSQADLYAREAPAPEKRTDTILVAARDLPCKGLDIALECASMDRSRPWRFVGMGDKTAAFLEKHRGKIPPNVEILPFLQREDLLEAYRRCAMLVLPSRRECWGLVIPEAASQGTPIVSTWGSGAAAEFLAERYPQYLAQPGDARSLHQCIRRLEASPDRESYSAFLREKAQGYTLEENLGQHLLALKIWEEEYGAH